MIADRVTVECPVCGTPVEVTMVVSSTLAVAEPGVCKVVVSPSWVHVCPGGGGGEPVPVESAA